MAFSSSSSSSQRSLQLLETNSRFLPKTEAMLGIGRAMVAGSEPEMAIGLERLNLKESDLSSMLVDLRDMPRPESTKEATDAVSCLENQFWCEFSDAGNKGSECSASGMADSW